MDKHLENRKTEGLYERKTLSTLAAAGTQAGRLPLPHDPGAEETGQQPDTPGVLQLRQRQLPCVGRWRHLPLSADAHILRLLQVVPLGGLAFGQGAGGGDLPRGQREAMRRLRCGVHSPFQPGEILRSLQETGTPSTEECQRPETPLENGQIRAGKSP